MSSTKKRSLALLFGGRSCEHEVSVSSARSMLPHIDRTQFDITLVGISKDGGWYLIDEHSNALNQAVVTDKGIGQVLVDHTNQSRLLLLRDGQLQPLHVDVVFPLLHGPYGEDGTVQGLLDLAGIATVGCGVAGSAVGMDKELSKRVFAAEQLPQLDYRVVQRSRWHDVPQTVVDELQQQLQFPLYVKPARMGSSVGVSRADDVIGLRAAMHEAARFDTKIIIEAAAVGYREVECAVLGNEQPQASVVGEIVPSNDFYDYEAKYLSTSSKVSIPADIDPAITQRIQELATRAFRAVGASGLARVDFFVGPDDSIVINEINTMPGFTPISMYPQLWAASGVSYPELVGRLADLAVSRHAEQLRTEMTIELT